jgi:hypothetical protein
MGNAEHQASSVRTCKLGYICKHTARLRSARLNRSVRIEEIGAAYKALMQRQTIVTTCAFVPKAAQSLLDDRNVIGPFNVS